MTERSVYIAEDDVSLSEVMQTVLSRAGYRVQAVPTGEQLLDLVEEEIPDAVLMDINMPGISGWEACKRLREDPRHAGIPVVAVTAQGGGSVEASARNALGFTDYVRKPFDLEQLLGVVEQAIANGGPPFQEEHGSDEGSEDSPRVTAPR